MKAGLLLVYFLLGIQGNVKVFAEQTNDDWCLKWLSGSKTYEARVWLQTTNSVFPIGNMSVKESCSYIERLYNDGALRVTVVSVRPGWAEGQDTAMLLIVTLPKAAEKRKVLLDNYGIPQLRDRYGRFLDIAFRTLLDAKPRRLHQAAARLN